jgi:uncharacterized protein (DUF2235 family)
MDATTLPASTATPTHPTRRIVLCLDGTWNSTYSNQRREDKSEVVKPSNVLKLSRVVFPIDPVSGQPQLVYYDLGIGSMAAYPGTANRLLSLSDKFLGGIWAAGYEGNIEEALHFLALNFEEGDDVFLFGFSRGAATARGLTRFLDWNGGRLPIKRDAFYLPELFRRFVAQKGEGKGADAVKAIEARRAEENRRRGRNPPAPLEFRPVRIHLLGVWDTVMALGSRFQGTGEGTATASKSFYVDHQPARSVRHARQALAIDEARFDFRPEIWDGHGDDQTLEQRWFAGVHSNVGGGYVDDGLANLAFHWILDEAEALGLAIDQGFADFYGPFAKDRLYRSESMFYRGLDGLRLQFGRGRRNLDPPAGANLTIDPSVFERVAADPERKRDNGDVMFPDLRQLYRPKNLLAYLACLPDLDGYLRALEAKAQSEDDRRRTKRRRDLRSIHLSLPQDVLEAIAKLRPACAKSPLPAAGRP